MELTPKKFKMGKIKTLIESFGKKQEKESDFQALCNLSDHSEPAGSWTLNYRFKPHLQKLIL